MSSAFQLFGAIEDSSVVDNINIVPQRPVKCFHNLVKKFDFSLIISNPKGSSNGKLGVTLEICTVSQKARTIKTAETLVRTCSIKLNCTRQIYIWDTPHTTVTCTCICTCTPKWSIMVISTTRKENWLILI